MYGAKLSRRTPTFANARRQQLSVRGKRKRLYAPWQIGHFGEELERISVPKANGSVAASAGNDLPIGAELN